MLTVTGTGARRAGDLGAQLLGHVRGGRRRRCRAAARGTPRRRAGPSWSSARRWAPIARAAATAPRRRSCGRGVSLIALEVVEVEHRDRERVAVTAGAGDHAAELGEDRAPVREPGQRVLAQQRLQPRALGDELLLELLGARRRPRRGSAPRRRRPARPGSPARPGACPSTRLLGREPGPLDHHDRGRRRPPGRLDRRRTRSPQQSAWISATSGAHARQRAERLAGSSRPRRPRGPPPRARARSAGASASGHGRAAPACFTRYPLDDRSRLERTSRSSDQPARSRSTSRCICSTSASADSKRRSPRMRSRKSSRSSRP